MRRTAIFIALVTIAVAGCDSKHQTPDPQIDAAISTAHEAIRLLQSQTDDLRARTVAVEEKLRFTTVENAELRNDKDKLQMIIKDQINRDVTRKAIIADAMAVLTETEKREISALEKEFTAKGLDAIDTTDKLKFVVYGNANPVLFDRVAAAFEIAKPDGNSLRSKVIRFGRRIGLSGRQMMVMLCDTSEAESALYAVSLFDNDKDFKLSDESIADFRNDHPIIRPIVIDYLVRKSANRDALAPK